MSRQKYILDASIIVTAFLQKEEKVDLFFKKIVQQLKDKKIEVYSTSFLYYEVANALRFAIKDEKKSLKFFNRIAYMPIKEFQLDPMQLEEVIRLSYELQTTIYDTSYHYLAQLLNGIFVTCDKAYYQKAKHLGHIMII